MCYTIKRMFNRQTYAVQETRSAGLQSVSCSSGVVKKSVADCWQYAKNSRLQITVDTVCTDRLHSAHIFYTERPPREAYTGGPHRCTHTLTHNLFI